MSMSVDVSMSAFPSKSQSLLGLMLAGWLPCSEIVRHLTNRVYDNMFKQFSVRPFYLPDVYMKVAV